MIQLEKFLLDFSRVFEPTINRTNQRFSFCLPLTNCIGSFPFLSFILMQLHSTSLFYASCNAATIYRSRFNILLELRLQNAPTQRFTFHNGSYSTGAKFQKVREQESLPTVNVNQHSFNKSEREKNRNYRVTKNLWSYYQITIVKCEKDR